MSSSKILYIFGSGRKEKIRTNKYASSEFFYGYFHMKQKYNNVDSIEMLPNETSLKLGQKILNFLDKVLRKMTNLPFFSHLLLSKDNYSKIKNSEIIISTNDRLALSALPMVALSQIKSRNKKFIVIVMGLFSKKRDSKVISFMQINILKLVLKKINTLIFLGKGEYQLANKMFPDFKDRFKFIPFGINLDFWKPTKEYSGVSGDYILFVGNDGNRDIDKVIEIGNSLDNMKVKIITSHKIPREKINNNIEVIYGNWNSSALTDETLKSYYENSILTFIPLKESFQPSGQSVCLQSMSLGIPVMITKTKGFWDLDNFNHLENIVFIDNNNINEWQNALASTLKNENLLNKLSKNSIYTVQKYYNQQKFFRSLEELI